MPRDPELPQPAHADLDSMLTRKFGKEVANYFSGSPLNRVGFLRGDHTFLSNALKHPTTSFLLCKDLQPLIKEKRSLAFVKYDDVQPLIGEDPYSKTEDEMINDYNSTTIIPQMIFLGLDQRVKDALVYKDVYKGAPFFAVDITPRGSIADACNKLLSDLDSRGLTFAQGRSMDLDAPDGTPYVTPASMHRQDRIVRSSTFYADPSLAAIYAKARQLLDWNARNTYCGSCGHPTLSVNAGAKRVCPSKDLAEDPPERQACSTRTTLSNLTFPRTDPTIIVAVLSHDSKRLLLGRQKRWPPYWFSTLAGFVEPAESVEDAVRREVWEESGVVLSRVLIHSTQPWPYPANLMIGAIAQVASPEDEVIKLDNDPELEMAKWFELDEIREALEHGTSSLGDDASPNYKEGNLRLPPRTAIAHVLITAVVEGGFLEGVTPLATASKMQGTKCVHSIAA
ncbi:NADH pyrophosphatase [Elasticomyces elasticus]|nr:NADH pyrophosphatase [Elasticomyces elasticus]